MKRRATLRPHAAVAVLAVAVAFLAAGCGGSDSSAGGDARAKGEAAALKWAKCMRQNGVDVPDPKVDSGGRLVITPGTSTAPRNDESSRRAMQACQHLMRDALPDPGRISKEEQARMRDAALAFTRCMREHGIEMSDPSTEGGGVSVTVNPNDPAFRRAAEACQDKMPLPGEGS